MRSRGSFPIKSARLKGSFAAGRKNREIAESYSVSLGCIEDIHKGRTWTWLEGTMPS